MPSAMFTKRIRLTAAIAFCLAPAAAFAQDAERTYSDHEIIIQLAAAKPVEVSIDAQITAAIPSGWQKFVRENRAIDFKVPYHTGIWGRLEVLDAPADDIDAVSQKVGTTLTAIDTAPLETTYLSGNISTLSGRPGGESWQFLIFSGTLKSGENVRFYAMCPERWFPAYRLFFEDIIRSLTCPVGRHH